MTVGDALQQAVDILNRSGLESARYEAEFLLSGLLRVSPTALYLQHRDVLPEYVNQAYCDLVHARSQRIPSAYLLKEKNFLGDDFYVDSRVLIPRPETELLVEWVLHELRALKTIRPTILDIGTGSGCIAVSIAKHAARAAVTALEISEDALLVAKHNAQRLLSADASIHFLLGDARLSLPKEMEAHFDMIVSNPPYISSEEGSFLEPELLHEPRMALVSGIKGTELIEPIIQNAYSSLKSGGRLFLEIGFRQAQQVRTLLNEAGFRETEVRKDYSGHERMVSARK